MNLKKQITILGILAVLFTAPFVANAAGLVPCGGPTESACTVKDIFILVIRTTNTLVGLAAIYAVYKIIDGGFWLITTMGNEEAISSKRKQITNAVVGFVLVMIAFMVINTVTNLLLLGAEKKECKIDLKDPLNYLIIHSDPTKHASCRK